MKKLKLACLGRFQASLGEDPVPPMRTSKVQALLIYLAVEAAACETVDGAGVSHRREALMELLWPDQPLKSAQQNLRQTLYQLRKAIPDQQSDEGAAIIFMKSSRTSVGINPAYAFELDVVDFDDYLQKGELEAAVALYRGDFLSDFYLPDSSEFEGWAQQKRSRYQRQASSALDSLVVEYLASGRVEQALTFAQNQLALDDLNERAQRQVMEALARMGRREAALAQYEACRQLLDDELGIEPDPQTKTLLAQIQNGELRAVDGRPVRVTAVSRGMPRWEREEQASRFVGREKELARLNAALEKVKEGQGRPQFIIGGAGRGKTALANAFARQALRDDGDLLLLSGACRGPIATAEPYLPLRQALAQLTGEVSGPVVFSREQAERLWAAIPQTIPLLVENGSDLVNALLSGREVRQRAATFSSFQESWFRRLCQLLDQVDGEQPRQDRLFSQVTSTLRAVSGERPLLLILEDLHWSDAASAGLLMHLCLELAGSRILLLGTYRPEEVHPADDHPLAPMIGELKRQFGDIWIDLGDEAAGAGRRFIDAYLDAEANELDEPFREKLYAHTGGHALFTVELLRAMQERGEIAQDEVGRWRVQASLDWDELPAKVEGVIEQRFGRLDTDLQEALSVAAVEGETFTAATVAEIQGMDERRLVRRLSREVERQHRLVEAEGLEWSNGRRLARYRFRHQLFQQFLYNELPESERIFLHEAIGLKLEEEAAEDTQEQAATLAWHFDQAGMVEKAVPYLLQAGDGARLLYASDEAVRSYKRAIAILKEQGDYEAAARVLMKLGLAYSNAFDFEAAQMAYDESFSLQQRATVVTPLPQTAGEPVTFRIGIPDKPEDFDVFDEDFFDLGFFPGLVKLTAGQDIVPDMAWKWEILDEGHTYLFHLRDDVYWSDGQPVTAEDFVYAWRRVLDPSKGAVYASAMNDLAGANDYVQGNLANDSELGIEAVDGYTLRVKLEQPAAHFLQVLALHLAQAIPRHVVESKGDDWASAGNVVSSGPFLLQSSDEKRIVLVRNPFYPGEISGNAERIEIYFLRDIAYLDLYQANQLDAIGLTLLTSAELVDAAQRWPADYRRYPRQFTEGLRFLVGAKPFNDPRVRRAFVLATDRQRLAEEAHTRHDAPATGGFVPPGMPGHVPDIALPYDPEEARRLLAEAGYPGGEGMPILRSILVPWQVGWVPRCVFQPWQEILGVTIEWIECPFENFSFEAYRTLIEEQNPHIRYIGWEADYPDPDTFLRTILPSSERQKKSNTWQNEEYESLIDQTQKQTDQVARLDLFRQAEMILVEEATFVPLLYRCEHYLVKPWIKNLHRRASNPYLSDVIIEPHDGPEAGEEKQWPAPGLPKAPHAWRMARIPHPRTLDMTNEIVLDFGLFPGLVQFNMDLDVVPDVARSWDILDSGCTYVFHLRDDVFWSDGQPVTAGDFVYAWRRVLDPHKNATYAELFFDIVGAADFHNVLRSSSQELGFVAVDDHTVQIRLTQPTAYFLQVLASSVATAVPQHVFEIYGERWPELENIATCGPFQLKSWDESSMIMCRDPRYHGGSEGNVDRVEIHFISSSLERWRLYDEDEIDCLDSESANANEFAQVLRNYADECRSVSRLMTSTLVFNTNIPPLDDVRVRRAFVLAVDRSRLGEVGGGLPATGGFVPPGIPGHVPNIALPYEPQEARRLLAEAGYSEGKNMPVLNVALMPWVVPYIPKYVLKQWQDLLGVEIIWREHAWADYFEHVKSEQPHIFNLGWEADLPDPDNFLRVGLKILTNWRHDTYEALIVKARGLMDHEHRLELFRKAEEILVQEVPILPLVYLNYHSLVKPWVKNFRLNPMGRPTWHKIIIEPH